MSEDRHTFIEYISPSGISVLSQRRLLYRTLSIFFEKEGNCRLLLNVYKKKKKRFSYLY